MSSPSCYADFAVEVDKAKSRFVAVRGCRSSNGVMLPLVARVLPTWALRQVGSYLGTPVVISDVVAKGDRDPPLTMLIGLDVTQPGSCRDLHLIGY